MNSKPYANKVAYSPPRAEIIALGNALSILNTSSISLRDINPDREWDVEELEEYGEL